MLQRIQTVYLLISALVIGGLYLWFPIIKSESGFIIISNNEPLVVGLIFGSILLTLLSILNFKKRQLQFVLTV